MPGAVARVEAILKHIAQWFGLIAVNLSKSGGTELLNIYKQPVDDGCILPFWIGTCSLFCSMPACRLKDFDITKFLTKEMAEVPVNQRFGRFAYKVLYKMADSSPTAVCTLSLGTVRATTCTYMPQS